MDITGDLREDRIIITERRPPRRPVMGVAVKPSPHPLYCTMCRKECDNENSYYYDDEPERFFCWNCYHSWSLMEEGRRWMKEWMDAQNK